MASQTILGRRNTLHYFRFKKEEETVKDTYKLVVDKWIQKITKIQASGHPICPYARTARYQVFPYGINFRCK